MTIEERRNYIKNPIKQILINRGQKKSSADRNEEIVFETAQMVESMVRLYNGVQILSLNKSKLTFIYNGIVWVFCIGYIPNVSKNKKGNVSLFIKVMCDRKFLGSIAIGDNISETVKGIVSKYVWTNGFIN